MKKNYFNAKNFLFALVCIILVISFLLFSDVFFNKTDPLEVNNFYFNKLISFQYQELHRITMPHRGGDTTLKDYYDQKLFLVSSFNPKLLSSDGETAIVSNLLKYKDGNTNVCNTNLKKISGKWFVESVNFEERRHK
ncbi:MAG: hypothetical protein NTY22_07150 [Proteobacteria bacterium]|nr:hypothetical protein [Pseudomonadota bacterium]